MRRGRPGARGRRDAGVPSPRAPPPRPSPSRESSVPARPSRRHAATASATSRVTLAPRRSRSERSAAPGREVRVRVAEARPPRGHGTRRPGIFGYLRPVPVLKRTTHVAGADEARMRRACAPRPDVAPPSGHAKTPSPRASSSCPLAISSSETAIAGSARFAQRLQDQRVAQRRRHAQARRVGPRHRPTASAFAAPGAKRLDDRRAALGLNGDHARPLCPPRSGRAAPSPRTPSTCRRGRCRRRWDRR